MKNLINIEHKSTIVRFIAVSIFLLLVVFAGHRAVASSLQNDSTSISIVQSAPWPIDTTFNLFPFTFCQFTITIKAVKDNPCPPLLLPHEKSDMSLQSSPCCCYDITIKNNSVDIDICKFIIDFGGDLGYFCSGCNFPDGWSYSTGIPLVIEAYDPTKSLKPGTSKTYRICGSNGTDFITCHATAIECNGLLFCDVFSNTIPTSLICVDFGFGLVPTGDPDLDISNYLTIGNAAPNPSRGSVSFECSQKISGDLAVKIFDSKGELFNERSFMLPFKTKYAIKFETNNLAPGNYTAIFTTRGISVARKFIVYK